MSNSQILMLVVTILYLLTTGVHFYEGRWNFGMIFAGYSLANIGFILAEN